MSSISFQVIHAEVPSLDHIFYGYGSQTLGGMAGELVSSGVTAKLTGDVAKGLGVAKSALSVLSKF